MKPSELRLGKPLTLRLRTVEAGQVLDRIDADGFVQLTRVSYQDHVLLSVGRQLVAVKGHDAAEQKKLHTLLARNSSWVAGIAGIRTAGEYQTITLDGHTFARRIQLPPEESIRIGITDDILNDLLKYMPREHRRQPGAQLALLDEDILIRDLSGQHPQHPFVVISAGVVREGYSLTDFRIHGNSIVLDVRKREGAYVITRARPQSAHNDDGLHQLVQGDFRFSDVTEQTAYKTEAPTMLDTLVQESDSYLALWSHYNQLERKQVIREARKLGAVRYTRARRTADAWRLEFDLNGDAAKEALRNFQAQIQDDPNFTFELGEKRPSELDGEHDEIDVGQEGLDDPDDYVRMRAEVVRCVAIDPNRGTAQVQTENTESERSIPEEGGYLYPPLHGDRVRLKRRNDAWQRIRLAKTDVPGLAMLIEGQPQLHRRTYKLLQHSATSLRRAFGGRGPTLRQEEAVHLALNTPDIALIQGPPGTGKTQVIAAICRLIEDEHKDEQPGSERILLTSYQHDAVETVAAKTSVFGLPSIKVGQRTQSDTDQTAVNMWIKDQVTKLKRATERSLEPPIRRALTKVRTRLYGYLRRPGTLVETVSMLGEVWGEASTYLEMELLDELTALKRRLEMLQGGVATSEDDDRHRILQAARGLRVEPSSFQDDGPTRAYRLLLTLKDTDYLSSEEHEVLDSAANWIDGEPLHFLSKLEEIRDRLLDVLTSPDALNRSPLPNEDVEALLKRIENSLEMHAASDRNNPEWVVWQFIDDLENDPHGAERAIHHYSRVLAATCQQTVSQPMQDLLVSQDQADLTFDTVIVDEAARANPLDLFIPMAHARRRIILVGDHRQLPHLLEPDVERDLQASSEQTKDILATSLFERLFNHLRALQVQDGKKRVITLDQQFRMHPALGRFVSDAFYSPYGESFESAPGTANIYHTISGYEGAVAAWVNLPYQRGAETPAGSSRQRPVEATWIARETKRILDDFPDISVGVITFYAAQVDCILREMKRNGLVTRDEDGPYKIAQPYQLMEQGGERLRVGTVDAFQGKEFDVVILSVTRSNQARVTVGDEASYRRKYGFLTLSNRLCVAMSRQKRLLIVVGDEAMVNDPNASHAVPALVKFYEFCGEIPYGRRIQP